MFDQIISYQFGFFSPGTDIEPKPDIIASLLGVFGKKSLIPTTVEELRIGPTSRRRKQLQFVSQLGDWNLAFEPHRILLMKQRLPGHDIGSVPDFCTEVNDIFCSLFSIIEFRGTRLSFVMKGLLPEMPEKRLIDINSRLLKLPSFYLKNTPCEWTTRNVAHCKVNICSNEETLNVITDINRIHGLMAITEDDNIPFDRIEVGFDINTHQKNIQPRFCEKDINPFLIESFKITKIILEDIKEIINV